jgi:hypothetical protein
MKLGGLAILAATAVSLLACTTSPPPLAPPIGLMPDLRGTWKGTWGGTPVTLVILDQSDAVPVDGVSVGPWQLFGQSLPGLSGILSVEIRNEMVSVNVRGRFGTWNGRLTLVLEPATVNGGFLSLVRLADDRLTGTGTAQMSWEPRGPVELIRQPQGPAATHRSKRSADAPHILPSDWNQVYSQTLSR